MDIHKKPPNRYKYLIKKIVIQKWVFGVQCLFHPTPVIEKAVLSVGLSLFGNIKFLIINYPTSAWNNFLYHLGVCRLIRIMSSSTMAHLPQLILLISFKVFFCDFTEYQVFYVHMYSPKVIHKLGETKMSSNIMEPHHPSRPPSWICKD